MRKIIILFILLLAFNLSFAQIYAPEGLNMPGTYDAFSNPPTVNAIAGIQKTGGTLLPNNDLGQSVYRTLIYVNTSGADLVGGGPYTWLFTSGPTSNYYANKWAGVNVTLNTLQSYTHNSGADNSITLNNNKYYTVIWENDGYSNARAIWMETSAIPISINTVSDNYVSAGTAVDVSITLSGSKSAEENIFVRYTTDNWATWGFVQATGTGTNYSATIPSGSVTGDADNQYYVFTSTVALANLSTADGNAVDLVTLSYSNNAGNNYPLPVELSSFSALAQSNTVNLTWETATEVNNYGFEIQRSVVGTTHELSLQWEKVGFVEGHGNSNSSKHYSYVDNSVRAGQSYSYRLKQIDFDGQFEYSSIVNVEVGVPMEFSLAQNYPNPFNPSTSIEYSVPSNEFVTLKIYDVLGNTVSTLVNENKEAGKYNITFDASNLTSGIYFYSINAGGFTQVKKMMLVK